MLPLCTWSLNIERLLLDPIFQNRSFDNPPTLISSSTPRPAGFLARQSKYPSGTIWRRFVAKCIFFDLLTGISNVRRIARMYEAGLAAIVMYEIPHPEYLDSKEMQGGKWDVEKVFGSQRDPSKRGMSEEALLDEIQVKVVYTPSYACTSFVVRGFSSFSALRDSFNATIDGSSYATVSARSNKGHSASTCAWTAWNRDQRSLTRLI